MESHQFQPVFVLKQQATWGQPIWTGDVRMIVTPVRTLPPQDHIVWSLLSLVCINPCCLGLGALIFSIKVRASAVHPHLREHKVVFLY
ncbi:dispanin subfamily A member 2b-like [Arapaima gigas]